MSRIEEALGLEWNDLLKDQFCMNYMKDLSKHIKKERDIGKIIYPDNQDVFNAYKLCQPKDIRVVIIGQDPYINGEAHGLSFSSKEAVYTPSLRKIEEAIREQVYKGDESYVWNNNLTRWAEQGIFLLNSVLTVNKGVSDSHKSFGWQNFTKRSLYKLSKNYPNIIYLLWGKKAQGLKPCINKSGLILECEHPVYANYQQRKWMNYDYFNNVNTSLAKEIIW